MTPIGLSSYSVIERKNLKRVCAWCAKVLCEGSGAVSHGICPACADRLVAEFLAHRPSPRKDKLKAHRRSV